MSSISSKLTPSNIQLPYGSESSEASSATAETQAQATPSQNSEELPLRSMKDDGNIAEDRLSFFDGDISALDTSVSRSEAAQSATDSNSESPTQDASQSAKETLTHLQGFYKNPFPTQSHHKTRNNS